VARGAVRKGGWGQWGGPGPEGGEVEGEALLLRVLALREEQVPDLPRRRARLLTTTRG
jgi:hypothetical protein